MLRSAEFSMLNFELTSKIRFKGKGKRSKDQGSRNQDPGKRNYESLEHWNIGKDRFQEPGWQFT